MFKGKGASQKLAGVPLFKGLSKRELEAILSVAKEVEHDAGHEIVSEGRSGAAFHLILEGKAAVTRGDGAISTLGPGDYFGEMAVIDGGPRTATVTAESEVRLLSIASWDFMPLLEKYPSIAQKLLLEMVRRLRRIGASGTD